MADATRRGFLGLTGVGVAAVSGVALATPAVGRDHGEPLVAIVEDGTLTLMVGERAVVVHDDELVHALRRAAGR